MRQNNLLKILILVISSIVHATHSFAEPVKSTQSNDILKLSSEIKGHQEQPKVLFILPWQTPENEIPDAVAAPQLIPEYLLDPIERAEFNRQSYLLEMIEE